MIPEIDGNLVSGKRYYVHMVEKVLYEAESSISRIHVSCAILHIKQYFHHRDKKFSLSYAVASTMSQFVPF